MAKTPVRPKPVVTHDSDGGVTVNDKAYSGLVVSIIGSHPAANGPRILHVEVYPYESGQDVVVSGPALEGLRHKAHHARAAFVAVPAERPEDDEVRSPRPYGEEGQP